MYFYWYKKNKPKNKRLFKKKKKYFKIRKKKVQHKNFVSKFNLYRKKIYKFPFCSFYFFMVIKYHKKIT